MMRSTVSDPRTDAVLPTWLQDIAVQLLAPFVSRRAPHALLLSAPEGNGLQELCSTLATRLLCEVADDGIDSCRRCRGCHLIAAGNHPDLRLTMPDPDKASAPITVAQLRSLIDFVNTTSHQGGWRIALLLPAERMNSQAANALLKSLEEPPPRQLFLLASHNPWRLPPTVRSRCQQHVLPTPTTEQAQQWLGEQGLNAQSATAALAAAGGQPMTALALYQDGELQRRDARRHDWEQLLAQQYTASALAAAWQNDAQRSLNWLATWLADSARREAAAANSSTLRGLCAAFDAVSHASGLLSTTSVTNLRPRLVLEDVLEQCLRCLRNRRTHV